MQAAIFLACLVIIALFVVSISLLSSIIQQWIRDERSYAEEQEARPDQEESKGEQLPGKGIFLPIAAGIDAVANAIHAYRQERDAHQYRQSKNERRTIVVLSWTACFAFVAAIAAIVSDWVFFGQLTEMRSEQRPWVKVEAEIGSDLTIGDEDGRVTIMYRTTNVGRSPAMRAHLFQEVYLATPERDPMTELHKFCDPSNLGRGIGHILFPGDFRIHSWASSFDVSNAAAATAIYHGNAANIFVVGCANYFFQDGTEHQTGFIYRIDHTRNIKPESGIAIDLRQRFFPRSDIGLEPYYFGVGEYAD